MVILPTGAGKSLCFQLPALLLKGPTLVIYPLLALMEDQRRRLEELGVECRVFRGGQGTEERREGVEALASGRAKIAISNPETLSKGGLLDSLGLLGIAHLAIDEAHCLPEWGESFRPAYLELGRIATALKPRSISAFTATASPGVLEATARHLFGNEAWRLVAGDPDRPSISYHVIPALSRERCLETLLAGCERPLICFASSRKGVESLASMMRERTGNGEIRFYHAGLDPDEKRSIEAWFLKSGEGILFATCAYGMGVDKKNIRTVIHWELPGTVEAYLQESGRAARDGGSAKAILILGEEEEARGEREGDEGRRARRRSLLAWARQRSGCRREGLLALLGTPLTTHCSGCDRCSGVSIEEAEGEREIIDFIRGNKRRFDRSALISRLVGEPGLDPPLVTGSGTLRNWRREDIRTALVTLGKKGSIRERRKRPWKGRFELGKEAGPGLAATLRGLRNRH
jgi:ATP-dependent DNA helicase RecQ